TTTTGFLRELIATDAVRNGKMDTELIERMELGGGRSEPDVARAAAIISLRLLAEQAGDDPFARADGWRLSGGRAASWWRFGVGGGDAVEIEVAAAEAQDAERTAPDAFTLTIAG